MNNQLVSNTLLTDNSADFCEKRKELKFCFLSKEKAQMQNIISDLQKSLKLNKDIVEEVLKNSPVDNQNILLKLNQENKELNQKLAKTISENEKLQAKVLVLNQIIEELKDKENENNKEKEEKELMVNLVPKKEFLLQSYEKRYKKYEIILLKYSIKNPDISKQLKEMQNDSLHNLYKTNPIFEK